jgi:RNA polymerase sigma-70 factor (ECF subfamily)
MKTDAEIVRAVLDGDLEAFAALVARHERAVWATAWRVLRDDHAAADASQEVFLLAFRRLRSLLRPEQFGVWLLRIARRQSVHMARRRVREPSRSIDDAGCDLPQERENGRVTQFSADADELLAAVARLPEHERLVVSLRYFEGYSVAEVASALGRPIGTVTKQLSRAIERLSLRTNGVIG